MTLQRYRRDIMETHFDFDVVFVLLIDKKRPVCEIQCNCVKNILSSLINPKKEINLSITVIDCLTVHPFYFEAHLEAWT